MSAPLHRHNLRFFPDVVNRWSRRKKLLHPFAGLVFFRRTSKPGCYNIASRHWPHLLCWSWCLTWDWPVSARAWIPHAHRFGGGWHVYFGPLTLMRQGYDRMISRDYEGELNDEIQRAIKSLEPTP